MGGRCTGAGATVVEHTRHAFSSIGEAVDEMTERVEQIAAVAHQIDPPPTSWPPMPRD